MDSFDSKIVQSNTYWWITSLAISVICCSVLFVWFSNYISQIREDMAVEKVRFDITESRLNEMSLDLQMLNRRSTVQQIQIIPAGSAQAQSPTSATAAPETPLSPEAAAAAAAAATQQQPPAVPAPVPMPVPSSAPAKH